MGRGARVADVDAAELVLVPADAGIRHRSVRLAELSPRNGSDLRPMRLGSVEIEAVAQVHAHAEPRLVDLEVATQPSTEEADHRRVGVGELDVAVGLRALARI